MATNFDAVLNGLHSSASLTDVDEAIEITSRREFKVPSDYNLILGYAGDINSQIVTFKIPLLHERHDLSLCQYKKIFWKNNSSKNEGTSLLVDVVATDNSWTAQWQVPPEAMTASGVVEVSLSLYDAATEGGAVSFAWNTPVFKGFSVGESLSSVSDVKSLSYLPAKDEILVVNVDSRAIVAPVGWNSVICSYGDIGVSQVFFEINRYIKGIDLLDDNTQIDIGTAFQTDTVFYETDVEVKPMFNTVDSEKNNKVLVIWNVSPELTDNSSAYVGTISISLRVQATVGGKQKKWGTTSFNKLTIASSPALFEITNIISRDESLLTRMVEEEVSEVIDDKIDNYMEGNEFEIGGTDNIN